MARSLTIISLLFQSTTHCRYRVYTKFLLTYTAIYRRNRKVLPLGIMALQPQSHFHLGTPYTLSFWIMEQFSYDGNEMWLCDLSSACTSVHAHVNLGCIKEYNTNSFSWLSYYEGIVQLTKIVIKTCNVSSHNNRIYVSLHALIFLYKPDVFFFSFWSRPDTCSLLIVYKNIWLC